VARSTPFVVWEWLTAHVALCVMERTYSIDSYSIMKTTVQTTHAIDNANLSLNSSSATVTDSVSHDSVTIQGLRRVQVARELRYWLLYQQHSHEDADRTKMLQELKRLQETLTETIATFSPETEEVTK